MTDDPAITTARYGRWQSPISIESIFNQPAAPAYPFRHRGSLYFLQSLAAEGGRIALMRWQDDGAVCLTPEGFNIRSAVHEYGGKCFCIADDEILFNNFNDGALYRQSLTETKSPVVFTEPEDDVIGYADLHVWTNPDSDSRWLIGVTETKGGGQYHDNALCAVPLNKSVAEPVLIQAGADFYAAAVTHGRDIAWIQWQLPDMPWDQAALFRGKIVQRGNSPGIAEVEPVLDQPDHSVCQPGFLGDGSLVYACDSPDQDWWNLYRWSHGKHVRLTDLQAEIGEAHWQFGQSRWVETGENSRPESLICIATESQGDRLLKIPLDEASSIPVSLFEAASMGQLWTDKHVAEPVVLVVGYPEERGGEIREVNLQTGNLTVSGPTTTPLQGEGYSCPQNVTVQTSDGELAYATFYPPFNPGFVAPSASRPPLLVTVHGGPTSRSSHSFNPLKHYFTSLGFAVLDINHRGSTGFGRQYRQRLLGGWGELDCMDIADSVNALIADHMVDPDAVFIRGGSAGGYAVLRALTEEPALFTGGACYYGIGNLITLSEITHKFEGRYTDKLVGEVFDSETARHHQSLYTQRSPIFRMERLTAPLILFQGLRDRVVPPEVTREVVALLEERGVRHDYVEYAQEGHGFRGLETRIDSLQRETRFFIDLLEEDN